jgi:glycosyltransferase involved in cell wall biosynthesis
VVNPSIAVIIPTFNRAGLVTRAIASVFAQSSPASEIIVVDDGSKDNTHEVLASVGPRIRPIHQANAGLSGARNTGIDAASSEWVAFLDDDDEYTADRLAIVRESIRRHPDAVVHMTNIALVASDGSEVALHGLRGHAPGEHQRLDRPLEWGLRGAAFAQGLVVRRDVLLAAGRFRKTFYEDMDLFVRLAFRGPWTVDRRCTVRLIRRPGEDLNLSSLWRSRPVENYEALVRIHREARALPELDARERHVAALGLATNLLELGCVHLAAGRREQGRSCLREAAVTFPRRATRLKVRALLATGPLGEAWARRHASRERAVRT